MSFNAEEKLKNARQTFSSWDNCMKQSYCKYPAIIGIIIAVLIAVSIICCCPSGRGKKRRQPADPPADYRQPNPYMGYIPPSNPPAYHGPNTATFDVPNHQANGDALPAMPTWSDGKLEESHRHDVEMGHLAPAGQATGVVPIAGGRSGRGGYRELPHHDDSIGQTGSYRGTESTHPYRSDLGAQGMMAPHTAYDPPPPHSQSDPFMAGAAAPTPYLRSSPPQPPYSPYSAQPTLPPVSPGQARPPSLLQVGRKPINGSMREI